MKKKKSLLISTICILSLILAGLLIYVNQSQKERSNNSNGQGTLSEDNDFDETPSTDEVSNHNSNPTDDSLSEVDEQKDTEHSDAGDNSGEEDADRSDSIIDDPEIVEERTEPIVLAFAGDVNFNESSKPIARYDREKNGILGGISSDLVEEMKAADIMMLNNEFAYSTRGTQTPDKSYTFRADPSRVDILHEMGVDIVSLANNHALDYGQDALLDTFTTLEEAQIDYVGAGVTMDRAKAPIYYTIGDTTIAYVAASRVIFAMDWYATDTRPGMIGTYDPTLFLESIEEAAANSDFVVVYVHWGVERTNYPVNYQKVFAKNYIDAGADVVIGSHPHVMQGLDFYKGKPIAYSMGNYWFNNATVESGLLKLYLDPEGTVRTQLLPVMAEGTYTSILQEKEDRDAYFDFMEEISFGVTFDEDGFMTEAP